MDELKKLREARKAAVDAMEAAHKAWSDAVESQDESQDLDELRSAFDAAERKAEESRERLEAAVRLDEAKRSLPVEPIEDTPEPEVRAASPKAEVVREELTYEKHGANSFFRDLLHAKVDNDYRALERLKRHQSEAEIEKRAISTTDGSGGEFVPPLWLQDEWVKLARPSRPIADTVNSMPLPPGTDTINLPTVSTGAAVAVQTDGNSVQSTDIATSSVTGALQTVAGQQDMSRQLFDRSVPGIDQVIFDDLARAYAAKLDSLVITGTVTNAKGINQLASTNSVTYTAATPTAAGLYSKIADAIQQVHTNRYLPPSVIAMHPRRWAWLLAASDSNSRPLVVPNANGPFNVQGILERVAAENVVGTLQGLPVIVDSQIPTTLGASTNEDQVYVYRAEDLYLYEQDVPTPKVFEEVLSNTLQVRVQLYGYYAVIFGRYPKSISKIGGTGLVSPTF